MLCGFLRVFVLNASERCKLEAVDVWGERAELGKG